MARIKIIRVIREIRGQQPPLLPIHAFPDPTGQVFERTVALTTLTLSRKLREAFVLSRAKDDAKDAQ